MPDIDTATIAPAVASLPIDVDPETVAPLVRWIAANLPIVAPVVALLASWLLYGVLGKRVLGADDDYWPALRRLLLPLLDRLGAAGDLYAVRQQSTSEFVGTVALPEERFEEELVGMGYYRNPLAALKRSPQGQTTDGSWAKRYVRLRALGAALRSLDVPVAGPLGRMLGRFLQASGDVLARRQVHVTIYTEDRASGDRIHVYAHAEANSLNPLTAWRHYVGGSQSHEEGRRRVREDLEAAGVPFTVPGGVS